MRHMKAAEEEERRQYAAGEKVLPVRRQVGQNYEGVQTYVRCVYDIFNEYMCAIYVYRYNELAAEGNEDDNGLVDKVYN